jgi:hypothetical protein
MFITFIVVTRTNLPDEDGVTLHKVGPGVKVNILQEQGLSAPLKQNTSPELSTKFVGLQEA